MPDFSGSKTQQEAGKYTGLRAPQTPPPPGLQSGLHRKTMFYFSGGICRQDGHARHPRQPVSSLPASADQLLSSLSSLIFFTEHYTFRSLLFPSRRQPANSLSAHIFSYQPTQPSFLLDRLTHFRSHFFFLFLPFHSIQKRKPEKPISLSFSYNFKSSPNLVQAFPSQSLSLLFSPSSQYILLHRPRSGHT